MAISPPAEKPKLLQPTKEFLHYLQKHPQVRAQIRARKDRTLLYAGDMFKPCYKDLADLQNTAAEIRSKDLLPKVLSNIKPEGTAHTSLLGYLESIEAVVPRKPDSHTMWRAVSGIFASNAEGQVSFYIGRDGASLGSEKVFATTELLVLRRNANVDALTRDLLDYYKGCLEQPQHAVSFSFIGGAGGIEED